MTADDRVPPTGEVEDIPPTSTGSRMQLITLGSLLGPAIARAERRQQKIEQPIPVPFRGWAESLGGGLWPGAHFIVSGTGVGKSQLTIQTSLAAAQIGIPTMYVGLELNEMQIALRVIGAKIDVRWSSMYLGSCSSDAITRARAALPALAGLPLYVDFAPARGWPASRLHDLAGAMRDHHPSGRMMIVLDYLQLVGAEPAPNGRRTELRERISDAAYTAHDVGMRFDAAVVVVSSAARNHYGLLASDAKEAGLITRSLPGRLSPSRVIAHPHVLVGLGKESGEVEFSADTVTVLLRWPTPLDNGETAIVVAVPKVRAGPESWSALAFDGGRFAELDVASIGELPAPPAPPRGGRGAPVADVTLRSRLIETVRRTPGLRSPTQLVNNTSGDRQKMFPIVSELLKSGVLVDGPDGFDVGTEPNR